MTSAARKRPFAAPRVERSSFITDSRSTRELRTAGDVFEKAAVDAREQFERLPDGDAARKQVVVGAVGKVEEFQEKAAAVWQQLLTTLKGASAGHEGAELILLKGNAHGPMLESPDAFAALLWERLAAAVTLVVSPRLTSLLARAFPAVHVIPDIPEAIGTSRLAQS